MIYMYVPTFWLAALLYSIRVFLSVGAVGVAVSAGLKFIFYGLLSNVMINRVLFRIGLSDHPYTDFFPFYVFYMSWNLLYLTVFFPVIMHTKFF